MLEHIGEQVRQELSKLNFVSIAAGYTEPIVRDDNGVQRIYPAARPWPNAPCEAGETYVNMSPHDGAGCIAFVDSLEGVEIVGGTAKYTDVQAVFRVVVWYDEGNILFGYPSRLPLAIANEITKAVRRVDFITPGIVSARATFYASSNNPDTIWSRYGMGVDDRALFMAPYRTLAVSFKFQARYLPDCFCPEILTVEKTC